MIIQMIVRNIGKNSPVEIQTGNPFLVDRMRTASIKQYRHPASTHPP